MQTAPLAALDVPRKMLVWTDGNQSKVTYPAPAAIAARHKLSEGTGGRPARIEKVIDTVIIVTDKLQDAHSLAKSARPSELKL
jgi:hypothetical protein